MSRAGMERGLVLLLSMVLVFVFVPLAPLMPKGFLDPSWAFGMNQAVADGLVFGHEMIFTFGPYASIYSRLYHPDTDLMMVAGSFYLALSYAFAAMLVSGGSRRWPLVGLALVLAGLMYSRDALLFSYPLLVAAYCYRYVEAGSEPRSGLLILALLFAPFGLLPLIKGSLLVLCSMVGGLALILFAARRKFRSAAVALAAGALAMVVFWLLAGQPLAALPAWFLSTAPIVSGYTQAMSIDGVGWEIPVYLLAATALIGLVYGAPHATPSSRTYIVLVFAGYLFLAFKGAFVRHDLHAMLAGTSLLLAVLAAAMLFDSRSMRVLLVAAVVICVGINRNYADVSPGRLATNVVGTFVDGWSGLAKRASGRKHLETEYDQALAALRSVAAIPSFQGTTDIYSYHQAFLLASENTWNPRPILQSYSAYTPSLAEANRAHLLGANSPENIAFRVETIDGRLPSAEDGASWPALLALYKPAAQDAAFLYLRRDPGGVASNGVLASRASSAFMKEVEVPDVGTPVFARIHIRPTFAGRLVTAFYKPSPILIRMSMDDGAARVFRIVPGMLQTGVLISPLVETTEEFAALYARTSATSSKRVRSIAISPAGSNWQWRPDYEIEFLTY